MKRTFWHNDATPVENTLDRVMYEIKFDDTEGLLLDSVSLADIIEDSDGLMAFDALITPYARLPARMDVIKRVMIRAGTTVQPLNVQTSEPFMQNGTANVAAIFELSDGQTISIFFHNPDTTPKKILPTDELISWKWLLNKKDITIVVAAERGLDLNPRQVAVRIMKLAEKNSASFIRSNGKRAERMQALEDLKTEITGLEGDLKGALHRLEIAKVEKEDRDMAAAEPVKPVEKNKVTLVWSEASEAENKEFSTLNELQQFMREEYENDASKLPDIGYNKHKVIINGEASRIDVAQGGGDFNPFNDNLSKYLIADGFDVDVEADLPSLDPEVIDPVIEPELTATEEEANEQVSSITEESAKANFSRYEDALHKVEKGSRGKAKGKELTVAKKEYEDAKIALQPIGEWMLAQANKTLSDVSKALTLPYGYLKTQPNLGDKFIAGNVNSVKQVSLYIRKDGAETGDTNQFYIEVRVAVDRPNVFINFTKGSRFAFKGEDIKVFGNSGVLTTATYEELTQAINTSLQPAIDKVVDSLNSTNSETNEQTNEQTEVETETEAAGAEGLEVSVKANINATTIIADAIKIAMDNTKGVVTTGDSLIWSISNAALGKMVAGTNKDGIKAYQQERIIAIQQLSELARSAVNPLIREDDGRDAQLDAVYEYNIPFIIDDNTFNVRLLCKKWKIANKRQKDKMHSIAMDDAIDPAIQTISDGLFIDLELALLDGAGLENMDNQAPPSVDNNFMITKTPEKSNEETNDTDLVPDGKEAELRALWTEQGVSKERQDELIADVTEKAKLTAGDFFNPGNQLSEYLKAGDLSGALKSLNQLDKRDLAEELFRAGFSLADTSTIKIIMAYVEQPLIKAAKNKTDGYGLRGIAEQAATQDTEEKSIDLEPDGKDNEVKTAKGTKIVTGFMVIEASKLIVSHDEQGNVNPDYPQEMQPRDRARDTSQAQIARIAKNLDPDMLGRTRVAYQGAPIIGKDGVVESGNGRAMAITLAYKLGKADDYRAWLLDIADMYGLNPDKIEHMKRPVLVRVRKTEVDRAQFAIEANQSDMLAMTATEKAKSDAARLNDAMVSKLSIEGDLTAASNRDFIMAFLQSLGDDETAGLLTTMGQPTKQLYDRAQAAVFAKAYNDDRLLELMADAEKPEIANIIKSLNQAAQPFITARNISEHATHTATQKIGDAIDVSLDQQAVDAIIKATEMLKKAKDSGMPIEELIKQNDLFGDIDPVVAQMALFIKDNNRSPARMGAAFVAMAEFVVKELESRQNASLFDDDMAVDMVDVLKAANAQLQKQYGEDVKAIGGTGGFIDMFTETRGQKEDREAFLARESANAEQQADPAATANINAASISETLKKKAIKYLQENPESHEIKGLSAKSLNVIIENIRSALFAEVKALSPLFIEVSDTNLSLKTPSGYLNLAIYKQKGFVTGYKVDFYGGNENYTNNLFDSTSTIEELRQWGFALPFDLDVKAFVANVIKPEVDKLLSAKVVDEPVIVEDENSTIDSMLAKVKTYFTCEDPLPESVPSNWIIMNTTRPLVGTKTFENASYLHGRFYAAIDPNDEFAKQNIKSNISLDGYVIKIISSDLSSKMIKNTIPEKYLEALGRLPVDKQNQYMLDNKDKINGNTYADAMKMMKDAYSEPETENESIPIPSDSDAVIAPEGEDSSEVDRQSEEQAEEDEPMEDFEPITPEVAEPTPAITGNTEIDGYKSKLLGLQQRQDRMKAVNKIVNNKKLTSEQKKSALADAGYTSEQYMVDAKPKWSDGKLGYEGYQLTNNNANIASTKKRITQLEAQDLAASKANSGDSQTSYDFDGGTIELDYSADRLKVDFDAIPDSDMNSKLKQNGFKWSPTNRVWQRQLTDNAISTANYLFGTNIKTAATMMTEEENKPRPNPIIQAVEPVIEPITPIEPVQNETAEIEAEITEPSNNAQTEKISAYSDELDSIRQETNSIELMRRLNDIVARIEADNLMDEMDVKLNQASDAVDELFKEAQKNAV